MEAQYRELKILLGVLILVIIGVVIGSIVMNRQGEANAKLAALEEALEVAKNGMEEQGDPMIIDSIELESVEVVRERRDEVTYEITLSIPNLKEVYDQLYHRVIEEEVWTNTSPAASLRTVHGESIENASREIIYLQEEVRIRQKDRGHWKAENPEAFNFIIPRNVLPTIAEDVGKVMSFLDYTPEHHHYPEGSLEEEFQNFLLENDFFKHVNFHVETQREGNEVNYSFGYRTNNLNRLSTIGEPEQFRHRAEEIVDRESLISLLWEELQEASDRTNILHTLKFRPYERSYDEKYGYEAVFRNRQDEIYFHGFAYGPDGITIPRLYLSDLEGYYTGHRPILEEPWPEPILVLGFDEERILSGNYNGEELAFLIESNDRMFFQIFDAVTGEKTIDIEIEDAEFPVDDQGIDLTNHYQIDEREGYYVLRHAPWKSKVQIAEKTGEGTRLHSAVINDFYSVMSNDVFFVKEEVHHLLSRYEYGMPTTFFFTLKNITTGKILEDLEYSGSHFGLNHYFSEKHGVLMTYPVFSSEINSLVDISKEAFRIYDLQRGEILEDDEITQSFRGNVLMEFLHPLDEDRLLIKTHLKEWWVADLHDFSLTSLGEFEGKNGFSPEYTGHLEAYWETRLTPMGENYYFVKEVEQDANGMRPVEILVWKDTGSVLEPAYHIDLRGEEGLMAIGYHQEEDILIAAFGEGENKDESVDLILLDFSYENLKGINQTLKAHSLEEAMEYGVLKHALTYYDVNEFMEGSMFRINDQQLYQQFSVNFPKRFHFDRDRESMFLITRNFTRHLSNEETTSLVPGLWGYSAMEIYHHQGVLYYEDERGVFLYEIEGFLDHGNE